MLGLPRFIQMRVMIALRGDYPFSRSAWKTSALVSELKHPKFFLLDFELSDSPLRVIVVRWYDRIIKEVEDVIPTLDYLPFSIRETLCSSYRGSFKQAVKPILF